MSERGTLDREALIVLGVFFGTCAAVVVPFIIIYGDDMPRADDGRALGARRAMGEDPIVFAVVIGTTILAVTIVGVVHRRLRPRLVRDETTRDVTAAARAAATTLAQPGAGNQTAWQAASAYLLGLRKRHWPYEADRIWINTFGHEVEVIAERSFQSPGGLLWHWGSRSQVARMDVHARAHAHTDGTITSRHAHTYSPGPAHRSEAH